MTLPFNPFAWRGFTVHHCPQCREGRLFKHGTDRICTVECDMPGCMFRERFERDDLEFDGFREIPLQPIQAKRSWRAAMTIEEIAAKEDDDPTEGKVI